MSAMLAAAKLFVQIYVESQVTVSVAEKNPVTLVNTMIWVKLIDEIFGE